MNDLTGTAVKPPTFEAYAAQAWPQLYRAAYLLTGQHADAEDLAQQTLLKAHQSWATVSRAASPAAYGRRMLTNTFISQGRPRRRRLEVISDRIPEVAPHHDKGPEDHLQLWPHVLALPPRQRAVMVLRYYEGLSEREIADALDCAPGTVKASAHRALKTLRAALEAADDRKES